MESTQSPKSEAAAQPDVKARLRKVALVALPVLVLAGLAFWLTGRNKVSTDDAQVDGHLIAIAAKVQGTVSELKVKDNEEVKQGQVLLAVDDQDYKVALDKAKAELAEAESRLTASSADTQAAEEAYASAQHAEVAVAEANVAARTASQVKAKADLERMKPLAERHEISAQAFDGYRTAADVADQELAAARKRLDAVRQEAKIRRTGTTSAKAREEASAAAIARAKASVKALELQVGYCTIAAPSAGLVTRRTVEPGQIIQPGQTLMMLVPLHDVWITANFKETELKDVKPGQEAEVEVDMNGRTLKGQVDSIAGSTGARLSLFPPENAAGNYVKVVQRVPVKIVVDAKEAEAAGLRPGLNVTATIHTR
ncbi:HlyD family secretion protein [uncultured Tolumonas sp.]|uniref:HlyD family secretion protein n=1 Tax=uncultured Tolumonas sp. TaxID=263765 RepID=UPI00292D677E|nr:HlyD family secretion protein [uncultured Tolumonas sp.]